MQTSAPGTNPQQPPASPELQAFSRRIDEQSLMPLWERTKRMAPGSSCVPFRWRYRDLLPRLEEAARLITARAAERRVLVLENPALRGTTYITPTLYTGLQIILPGEIAPSHRHSPSALRFMVSGEGGYTAVGGERTPMSRGDFVVTPSWAWHDHGNLGTEPVIWMDGLDTAFGEFFGALFREDHPEESHPLIRQAGDASSTFGACLFPVQPLRSTNNPVLVYPYARSREALDRLARQQALDPCHGAKLKFVNPATGGAPFPTMSAFLQWVPAGFQGSPYRTTESTVFNVAEGTGAICVGDQRLDYEANDIVVVPPWAPYRIEAQTESVLFSYSDRAAQETLGFWREEPSQERAR
ncbi:MAG TPA: cupin domain-containing protein [Ramlibacter sp.]|jgi:gentisate 1,2-dioxygenase|nr:cupin domain-containing protein [Ramlibacter sp.]